MLKCEKCGKNPATVYYKQTVNGKTVEYRLCPECAEQLQASGKLNFALPSFFSFPSFFGDDDFFSPVSFFPALEEEEPRRIASHTVKSCPLCGSRFRDLVEKGKAGCAECYHTFADELEKTIRSLHGRVTHIGRKPGKTAKKAEKTDPTPEEKIAALREELQKAVASENYEQAVTLRDSIRELENKSAGRE